MLFKIKLFECFIYIRLVYFAVEFSREVVPRLVYAQALSMQIERFDSVKL
jgi:hypothetical protein